jgi:hypothetical protein
MLRQMAELMSDSDDNGSCALEIPVTTAVWNMMEQLVLDGNINAMLASLRFLQLVELATACDQMDMQQDPYLNSVLDEMAMRMRNKTPEQLRTICGLGGGLGDDYDTMSTNNGEGADIRCNTQFTTEEIATIRIEQQWFSNI